MRTLIVDGYNVIYAWDSLRRAMLGSAGPEEARRQLVAALAAYAAVRQVEVTVVFDGSRLKGGAESIDVVDGVTVRYSGQARSADHVIERLAYEASRAGNAAEVTVATSDRLQRELVRAMGVSTIGARALETEVGSAAHEATTTARRGREAARFSRRLEHRLAPEVRAHLEELRRGGPASPQRDAESSPDNPPVTGSEAGETS